MEIYQNRCLKEYSTFKIGGPARYLIEIKSIQDAVEALKFADSHSLKWMNVGKGSNCLFPDHGFDGLVIVHSNQTFSQQGSIFTVGSGFSFAYLGIKTAQMGFSGLEFASGIPASVGGAIYMNAGASSSETKDFLKSVTFVDNKGKIQIFEKKELYFSYRKSCFHEMFGMIVEAQFELIKNPMAGQIQKELLKARIKSQPYQDPSIGCFFKNPDQTIRAGRLIDQCGLKGLKVGGAEVSSLHANFIVNKNQACASDVIQLKKLIQEEVYKKTEIKLEEEVMIIL